MAYVITTETVGDINYVIAEIDGVSVGITIDYSSYYERMAAAAEASLLKITSIEQTLSAIASNINTLALDIDAIKNRASDENLGIYTARSNGLTVAQQRAFLMSGFRNDAESLNTIKEEIANPTQL